MSAFLNKWAGLIIIVGAIMWLITHDYIKADKVLEKIPDVKIEKKIN